MSTKRLTKYRGAEKRRVPETKPIIRQGRGFESPMLYLNHKWCVVSGQIPFLPLRIRRPSRTKLTFYSDGFRMRIASHVQRRPSYSFPSLVAANYSLSRPPRVFLHLRLGKGCARYSVRIRVGIVAPNSPAVTARYWFSSYSSPLRSFPQTFDLFKFSTKIVLTLSVYIRWK